MKNKVALITGASSGMGMATAQAFAAQGISVVLGARRLERIEELAKEFETKYNIRAAAVYMDVKDYAGLEKAIASLPEDLREVDILVNNAGLSLAADKIQDANIENLDEMFAVNVKGTYNMTRLLLPGMVARNSGHVINIGSIAGLAAYPTGSGYCASKAAVKSFTEATRLDLHTTDVRVTLIEPGMTSTGFMNVKFKDDKDYYDGLECMTPENIADIILYVVNCPPHVNICELVVMPTHQATATTPMYRRK